MNNDALIKEIARLSEIINRAKTEFFKDGSDGVVAHSMLLILMEAEQKETK
jgi:hypothetical protein